ncbi:DUF805 domain-containing protein [Deinococcus hopiensis]|uniref:Uncharacterized membrane protein YhaH, DUF805 family n=1 Tax=Deinococcus hopiensis KR-140 TaxID=695939 RepID=A0A1W1UD09_9DEIO|nr:DUF805 domain-containing protein [Deinococcus hopiensis]SMB78986.1 Uncharacterized membrane protein YhaH, DUF805 family [Deinococcus hopiensis KR-140]
MKIFLNVIKNHYADFRGRARRNEYWMFALFSAIIGFVLQIPFYVVALPLMAQPDEMGSGLSPALFLSMLPLILFGLIVFIPSLAVTVRRLHDGGRSGWWYLVSFVPLIGSFWVLYLLVLDSEPGNNKWGPSPKGSLTPTQQW